MGFEIFGMKVWDFTQPFSYFEAFSGIAAVLLCAAICLCVLRYFSPKA